MAVKKGFLAVGHLPTLFAAFLYFDMSFMVWVLLGPLGVLIAKDLGLTPAEKGLMVATPVLAGAALRIVTGIMVDHLGPKLTGTLLQIASRWYPPEHQGVALGIAGAGNSGTAFAALFAPSLAVAFGWNTVFGLAAIPLAVALAVYLFLAKESPNCPPPQRLADYLSVLKIGDTWWFMFLYSVTFGGFVGLSSSLTIYFNDEFGLSPVTAGYFTAACVFAGSLVRPVGGAIADRIGGVRSLSIMLSIVVIALGLTSLDVWTAVPALAILVVAMLALGMGNGAVFQLVPQRFQKEIGVLTGLVGMAGGIGGFYLASSLGYAKQLTGSYHPGFLIFALLAAAALVMLTGVKSRWRRTWGAQVELGASRL